MVGLVFWMGLNFFRTRIRIGALPRLPGSCGWVRIFLFFGFGVVWGAFVRDYGTCLLLWMWGLIVGMLFGKGYEEAGEGGDQGEKDGEEPDVAGDRGGPVAGVEG